MSTGVQEFHGAHVYGGNRYVADVWRVFAHEPVHRSKLMCHLKCSENVMLVFKAAGSKSKEKSVRPLRYGMLTSSI